MVIAPRDTCTVKSMNAREADSNATNNMSIDDDNNLAATNSRSISRLVLPNNSAL